MKIKILKESPEQLAFLGNGLSYGETDFNTNIETFDWSNQERVLNKLSQLDDGHNNALEQIDIWCMVEAPRYWWQEFDTYRVGISKRSESTMHTLFKNEITIKDFEYPDDYEKDFLYYCVKNGLLAQIQIINTIITEYTNNKITALDATKACKRLLPESFLQTRLIKINYKALRNIYKQRKNHKLPEWHIFLNALLTTLKNPDWICK